MKTQLTLLQQIKRRQRIEKAKKIAGAIITGIAIITISTALIVVAKLVCKYVVFIWESIP